MTAFLSRAFERLERLTVKVCAVSRTE
jgi:hypothetical protein